MPLDSSHRDSNPRATAQRPYVGISVDIEDGRFTCRPSYADAIVRAGGVPVLLPCVPASEIPALLEVCDAIVTTGGDDPRTEAFGVATDPRTKSIDPRRQRFELELLAALDDSSHPLLAICLGMQLLALHAGGRLDQYLPASLPTHADHWNGAVHRVEGEIGSADVHSHHRQAVADPGGLRVIGRAPDGVIEAIATAAGPWRIGVQWHPERTGRDALGDGLFERLVAEARRSNAVDAWSSEPGRASS